MKVVIIEDEPLMADELEREINGLGQPIEVVQKLNSVQKSIKYFSNHDQPDLFFSDIQLSDGLSFEIFDRINATAPIVFCTAYNDYAFEAFQTNGIDYLLKPLDSSAISRTIGKFRYQKSFESNQRSESQRSILIHRGDRIFSIKTASIRLISLRNGVVSILTKDNRKHIVNQTLESLEAKLGLDFFRANRQVIVHKEAIEYVSQHLARKLLIELNFPFDEEVIISKANATSFLRWFENS